MTNHVIARRNLLQSTAAVGGAAFAGSLLPGIAQAQQGDLKATSGSPVFFRGWPFRTDVVQSKPTTRNSPAGSIMRQ